MEKFKVNLQSLKSGMCLNFSELITKIVNVKLKSNCKSNF